MNDKKITPLRSRMREDLRLRNYSPRTEKTYLFHVSYFARWLGKSPATAGEEEIRKYLTYLRGEKQVSLSHFKQAVGALRFFTKYTLGKEWLKDRIPYPRQSKTLPEVMSQQEVVQLLEAVENKRHRMVFEVMYGAGLRLMEALTLKVTDVDSKLMLLRVRAGKGARERAALLSPLLLETLRKYYQAFHPKSFLFPGTRKEHIASTTIQRSFAIAAKKAGIRRKVCCHTLRHSFASHCLENGTDVRIVQELLGHKSLHSTLIYLHVTPKVFAKVPGTLDTLLSYSTPVVQ